MSGIRTCLADFVLVVGVQTPGSRRRVDVRPLYLFIVAYAISLFLLAVVLVPTSMDGVGDSYAYFMEGRRWFFGVLLVVVALDVVDTFLKGSA